MGSPAIALVAEWLAYQPAYLTPRGAQTAVLGAHAFSDGAERSLCGYAPRSKTKGPAATDARRCTWCRRVLDGISPARDQRGFEVSCG